MTQADATTSRQSESRGGAGGGGAAAWTGKGVDGVAVRGGLRASPAAHRSIEPDIHPPGVPPGGRPRLTKGIGSDGVTDSDGVTGDSNPVVVEEKFQ